MRYLAGFVSAFYNPLKNPDAPTIGTATGASITFTAPTNTGGSAITAYFAIATDSSSGAQFTGTAASSPITVSGLTIGNTYTYRVYAVNSYGPSALSAVSNSTVAQPVIGQAFGGGFFAGQISTVTPNVASFNLVVSPLSSGQSSKFWKNAQTAATGADSVIDGPQNTADMVADGNSTVYPAAHFCNDLVIGGFSDWYMPAQNELEICYFNLKPSTNSNNTSSGINANAVPARASDYTAGTPAQTSATDFQSGGTQAFTPSNAAAQGYWSSTEFNTTRSKCQYFLTGAVGDAQKSYAKNVRAVRRIAV